MRGMKPVLKPLGEEDYGSGEPYVPERPHQLKRRRERACWAEVTRVLSERRVLDEDAAQLLAAYCVQWGRFWDAEAKIKELGETMTGAMGGQAISTWVLVSNHAFDRMVRLGSELGLTPVSRKRVVKVRAKTPGALQVLKVAS